MPDWCVDAALRLSALGVAVVPVDPEEKKPLIKGFSKWRGPPTRKPITQWWSNFPDAGLGILTGAISGLTVVDIDDATLIGEAIDTYGDTPLQTATPSGGRHLYFGHRNEGNKVRVGGHKIDIRGQGGLVLAPPTMRADRRFYSFVKGHWDCIPELPAIPRAQSARLGITQRTIPVGERDNALFRHCLAQARHCDNFAALIDVAHTFNENCLPALSDGQVEKTARSAWGYEITGTNSVGTRGFTRIDSEMRDDLQPYPNAFVLMDQLKASHEGRHSQFAIAAEAMVRDEVLVGWTEKRINKARRILVREGYLRVVHRGGKGRGDPSQYAFTGKGAQKGHEYN